MKKEDWWSMLTKHDIKTKLWNKKLAPSGFDGMHGAFEAEQFCEYLGEVLYDNALRLEDDLKREFDKRDRKLDATAQMAFQKEGLSEKMIRAIIKAEVAEALSEMADHS